tara:strand:+ start:1223 stop:1711 length:489 start_codon:yes stop_codon:yes gene_type:complete
LPQNTVVSESTSTTTSLLQLVEKSDVADYWLKAAVSTECLVARAFDESAGDLAELHRNLRAVQTYVSVRKSIGEMVEKSSTFSTDSSWDPFAPDVLDKQLDVSAARAEFDASASTDAAVELYKAGLSYNDIIDKTGLSRRQVEKAVKKSGIRRKRKTLEIVG